MGNIYTYFVAEHDAAAAATADAGPVGLPSLDAVDATVQAGSLMALLTGRPYEEITAAKEWARLVSDPAHELAWVVSMPDAFVDALAGADNAKLAEVVEPWSQTEEFWGAGDPEELLQLLSSWRGLAQVAKDSGQHLFCWMAL